MEQVFADNPQRRTRLFANIDLAVNTLTLAVQVLVTGRLLRWLGVGLSLALLPFMSMIGFGILAAAPVLGVVITFQVLRRAGGRQLRSDAELAKRANGSAPAVALRPPFRLDPRRPGP